MLPSLGTRISRRQRGAARRFRSLSLRLEHRRAYSYRIDRMPATEPQEQARARPTAECFSRHVKAITGRAPRPHQPRVRPLGRPTTHSPAASAQPIDHDAEPPT